MLGCRDYRESQIFLNEHGSDQFGEVEDELRGSSFVARTSNSSRKGLPAVWSMTQCRSESATYTS